MPFERDDGRYQFTLRLPEELVDAIGDATGQYMGRAQSVLYLLDEGLHGDTDVDYDEPYYTGENGGSTVVSVSTKNGDAITNIETIEEQAEENDQFNDFSHAARCYIQAGVEETDSE